MYLKDQFMRYVNKLAGAMEEEKVMPEIEKKGLLSGEEWALMEKNKAYDDSSSTKVLDNLVEERDIIKQVEDDEMFRIVNENLEDKDFNFKANNNKIAKKANILIVDDNEANRELLKSMVEVLGHNFVLAENGISALVQMEKQPPDLVLLDILMPEMDGYAVLDRMKVDAQLCLIPVIMITAVDDMDSMVKCVAKGADDYLLKPFNVTLLTARIKSCLEKKRLRDMEREYSLKLKKEVYKKTKELEEAHNKLEILDNAKSDFLHLISHELRTPLNGVIGSGEIMADEETDEETRQEFKEMFHVASDNILNILDGAILLSEIDVSGDSFHLNPNLLKPILDTSLKETESFAESQHVAIDSASGCIGDVLCDKRLLGKALTSLVKVAIKFSQRGGRVNILCESIGKDALVKIHVNQGNIPDDVVPNLFEIFTTSGTVVPGGDLGLDPPVAERIIKLFGGSVIVENNESAGMLFTVRLKKTE